MLLDRLAAVAVRSGWIQAAERIFLYGKSNQLAEDGLARPALKPLTKIGGYHERRVCGCLITGLPVRLRQGNDVLAQLFNRRKMRKEELYSIDGLGIGRRIAR